MGQICNQCRNNEAKEEVKLPVSMNIIISFNTTV